MQGFLFSSAIDQKEIAVAHLLKFDLVAARKLFEEALETDPFLADLDSYLKIIDYLSIRFKKRPGDKARITTAMKDIRLRFENGQVNRFIFEFIENLLATHLLTLVPADYNDYLDSDATFHISECHLITGQSQVAREKLIHFLGIPENQFSACLWGKLGDAAWEQNAGKDAEKAYFNALFIDPESIDFMKLRHPKIKTFYENLKIRFADEAQARNYLPAYCWFRQLYGIPRVPGFLSDYIEQRLACKVDVSSQDNPDYLRFAYCLYIDQSGLRGAMDFRAREEMQQIDSQLFEKYINQINPSRIKKTDARIRSSLAYDSGK